jgi:hypothetical protein
MAATERFGASRGSTGVGAGWLASKETGHTRSETSQELTRRPTPAAPAFVLRWLMPHRRHQSAAVAWRKQSRAASEQAQECLLSTAGDAQVQQRWYALIHTHVQQNLSERLRLRAQLVLLHGCLAWPTHLFQAGCHCICCCANTSTHSLWGE